LFIKDQLYIEKKYMPNDRGSLRQPVLKGIREDKLPAECKE
jgi:bifunctional non-homologous end joining protein LigD